MKRICRPRFSSRRRGSRIATPPPPPRQPTSAPPAPPRSPSARQKLLNEFEYLINPGNIAPRYLARPLLFRSITATWYRLKKATDICHRYFLPFFRGVISFARLVRFYLGTIDVSVSFVKQTLSADCFRFYTKDLHSWISTQVSSPREQIFRNAFFAHDEDSNRTYPVNLISDKFSISRSISIPLELKIFVRNSISGINSRVDMIRTLRYHYLEFYTSRCARR